MTLDQLFYSDRQVFFVARFLFFLWGFGSYSTVAPLIQSLMLLEHPIGVLTVPIIVGAPNAAVLFSMVYIFRRIRGHYLHRLVPPKRSSRLALGLTFLLLPLVAVLIFQASSVLIHAVESRIAN